MLVVVVRSLTTSSCTSLIHLYRSIETDNYFDLQTECINIYDSYIDDNGFGKECFTCSLPVTFKISTEVKDEKEICKQSFSFKKITSNWQAAGIKDYRLSVVDLGQGGKVVQFNTIVFSLEVGVPFHSSQIGSISSNEA